MPPGTWRPYGLAPERARQLERPGGPAKLKRFIPLAADCALASPGVGPSAAVGAGR